MKQLAVILSMLFTMSSFAQKEYKVMDWKTEYTLNTYLIGKMQQQYAQRSKLFADALKSKSSLQTYAENVRRKFRELIGSLPPKSPLNTKITGTIKGDGCKIEKLVYESFANHHVTANVYIPDNAKGKMPAVIMFCGHEDVSKATESYQKTALLLANNGFVVMVIDPISQSERYQLTDVSGKPLTRGGTTEHTLVNEAANLIGSSAVAYELWDNVRGLDYLVARPEVDADKIGCVGNSGGAIQAIYFAAFDPRVKVIVPCSYLATRERTMELSGPADGCAQMPGEGSALLEMSDYLIAAAPKPILVLAGRYDFIDYAGTVTAFNDLKKAYKVLGEPSKVKLFTFEDGHGISYPKRKEAAKWFRKWFMGDTAIVEEGRNLAVSTDKELFATQKGQVNLEYPNEVTVFDHIREVAGSLNASRIFFLMETGEKIRQKISRLVQEDTTDYTFYPNIESTAILNGQEYFKMIFRKQGLIPLPVLLTNPNAAPKKIVIWLPDNGKRSIVDSTALMRSYLDQGAQVMVCDVSGTGETADAPDMNDPKYFNREYRNAMLALHTGGSVVAQRVNDVLLVIDYAKKRKLPIEIHASGPVALAALHAVFLRNNVITKLYLYKCITSFTDILLNPLEKNWYSWVIPGVLKYYDIPDLVKLIGEDKVEFVK